MEAYKKQIIKAFNRYNFKSIDSINKERILRQPKQVYFMYFGTDFKKEDFKQPFFNDEQIIDLSKDIKILTYCGKNQSENINKNAIVLNRLTKNIYRVYLMDSDLNLRDLFIGHQKSDTIGEHNGYNLDPRHYINQVKEEYSKEEIIYILNKISNFLVTHN